MKYKFIFLVLSSSNLNSNNNYFNSNDKYNQLKFLNKKYFDLYSNDIKFFYIENDPYLLENICEKNDFIYVKADESVVPGMLIKQQESVKYINSKYNYDYIIFTNLTTLWNIPVLLSLYETIPRNNFFGGHTIFDKFVSGTGIFISHDLTPLFLQANRNDGDNNDVVISKHMKNCHIPIYTFNNLSLYKMNYQIVSDESRKIPETTNDILCFRIIENDLFITKLLINILYNIT